MSKLNENAKSESAVGAGRCMYLHLTRSEFAKIAIVIASHLHVEDLGFGDLRVWDEDVFEQVEHVLANAIQFRLDHLAILVD